MSTLPFETSEYQQRIRRTKERVAARGGTVVCDAGVTALEYRGNKWHAQTPAGAFAAPVVVNAAGARADRIGEMAGAEPVGLVPEDIATAGVTTFDIAPERTRRA